MNRAVRAEALPWWARPCAVIGTICFVVIAGYVVFSLGRLPNRIPMQYDANNKPTWYASPATFYAFFLVVWLGVNGLLFTLRRNRVVIPVVFAFVNYVLLLVFHLTYQNATGRDFLYLTSDQTVLLILPAGLLLVGWAIYLKVQARPAV